MSNETAAADRFHRHLDGCQQCRNHPMNLCVAGADLLRRAVTEPRVAPPYDVIQEVVRGTL